MHKQSDLMHVKNKYNWTSMIRQMEFVTKEVFFVQPEAAVNKTEKELELSERIEDYLVSGKPASRCADEGLCLQCMA